MAAFFRKSWGGFGARLLDDADDGSASGLQDDGFASDSLGDEYANDLQNDDLGDGLSMKTILVVGGVVILVVGGVCKLISMLGGSKDDPGNALGSQDDAGDGLGLHVQEQDDYYNVNEFGVQHDCNDVFGLLEDFAHGFGSSDESFGSQWRSIVEEEENFGTHSVSIEEMEAEEVETPSVLFQQKSIKHYRSTQKILLVGEGNFSFSACLAKSFGYATNMVATSLDSYSFIMRNYGLVGLLNLITLQQMGCRVIHEVDATTMACHVDVGSMVFDRIVYNFPHAGFNKLESRVSQLKRQRSLVRRFFENARTMLSSGGEIHVAHKTNGFFKEWRIEELAAQCGLHIIEKTTFKLSDYPGYETKYGFGGNKNFNCFPSMTFKFGILSPEMPKGLGKVKSTRTKSGWKPKSKPINLSI